MKRILSLFMIVLMVLSPITNIYATSDYERELLSALSIIQGDPNGNMRYGDKVSRAECAKIVVATSTYRDFVDRKNKTSSFKDVTSAHWASPYVAVGIKNNLFKGYFDATFRPENTVLYEEAVTMFLRVLGYTDEDFGNNWPYDQIEMAKKIGLLDSVNKKIGQELTRRDISAITYNTLMSKAKGSAEQYLSNFNTIIGPKTVDSVNWYEDLGADSSIIVVKDGVKSSASDVVTNDIIYYMEEYNTVLVYSKKVTGIYETATPNKETASSVTVSGITYNIEGDNAYSKLSSGGEFNYGDTVTLLLGKSGGVADVISNTKISNNICGFLEATGTKDTIVSGTTVTRPYIKVVFSSGEACEYIANKDYSSLLNRVVSISFNDGIATVSAGVTNNGVSGKVTWTSNSSKIGSSALADDVSILEVSSTKSYETAITSTVFPQRLNGISLSSSAVLYASKNADGLVDELIITDTTGDMHTYGIMKKAKNSSDKFSVSGSYEYIENGKEYSINTNNKSFSVESGSAVKIVSDGRNVSSISNITKVSYDSISEIYGSTLRMNGNDYTMSDNVQIYVKDSYEYTMITMDELIENYNNYQAAVYIDKAMNLGGRVRIIILS